MTLQSRRSHQPSSYRFPLSSNTAGAPLPLIPRRTRSAPPVASQAAITSLTVAAVQPIPSSAITDDSDSSSSTPSDGSRPTIRIKRERGLRITTPPSHDQTVLVSSPSSNGAADSIAFPSSSPPSQSRVVKGDENVPPSPPKPLMYTPGMLRLGSRSSPPSQIRLVSDPSVQGGFSKSAPTTSTAEKPAPVIRKKSGQLVKPSLKSSKPGTRGSLTVVTGVGITSKSEPATPSCKAVHFDKQLEHVKLFLAEQKPAAVSRDGSPTDDTSGTESDFPSFIYGDKEDKRRLVMRVTNMPSIINLDADVALEEFSLSEDGASIVGRVRVRNIAFSKWIAVRFTFDNWQTTSEVTGKYMDSINAEFDHFSFAIKLSDLLARIEEKTLFVAVRYSVEGKEMWDNNNGRNYQASFSRVKPADKGRSKLSDDEGSVSDVADLHSKLEKVVEGKTRTGPAFLVQNNNSTRRNSAGVLDQAPPIFRTSSNSSFASRYDFNASFRQPWKPVASPGLHTRTMSYPLAASAPPSSIPWPQKGASNSQVKPIVIPILGSPRDLDPDIFNPTPRVASDLDDTPFPVGSRQRSARNHQRGYFDLNIPGFTGVRRTPPGSPDEGQRSPPRFHSFPPLDGAHSTSIIIADPLAAEAELSEDSAVSTPSITTPTSSTSSSPTEPFLSLMLAGVDKAIQPVAPTANNYSQLINKFCFFTGSDVLLDSTGAEIPRTQSASDVEEFLAGTSPHDTLDAATPTRSSSFDDIFSAHSGPPTPTNDRRGPILSGLSTPTYGMY
ncbi:putative phosphatase regulatory subunit-domain-containing protein [Cyathus striatus]|nr:putative phosphatase regulatory subunit-domain-containing protein [Cyathus striatus]